MEIVPHVSLSVSILMVDTISNVQTAARNKGGPFGSNSLEVMMKPEAIASFSEHETRRLACPRISLLGVFRPYG